MVLYLFIFRILDLLNTILVICRCSVLCLITCFFNYTALYLLPLAIIVDWGIFQFSIQSVFKNQLLDLNKAVEEFKEQGIDLEIIEDDIIKEIDTEMRKYQLFQWGNRQGDKRTIVIRANKLFGQFKSFAFYNASSFIFVPKTFYPQSIKDMINDIRFFNLLEESHIDFRCIDFPWFYKENLPLIKAVVLYEKLEIRINV